VADVLIPSQAACTGALPSRSGPVARPPQCAIGFVAFRLPGLIPTFARCLSERVIEIQLVGGRGEDRYWMDTHDGCVPNLVWDLLEYTLPRCPNIARFLLPEDATSIINNANSVTIP
jgi:hypothetical protein